MAANRTVADSTSHHLGVVLLVLEGLTHHIRESKGNFDEVEMYLNIFPADATQFNAILEACHEHGIEAELDTAGNRVRLSCGPRPGAPVTVWGDDPTEASS